MSLNFKVLVVGEAAVGKTSLASRYTTGAFKETHLMTVGANFMLKNVILSSGEQVRLNIWDTAGQEKFRKIVETYYKGGKGVLVCFSITNRESFKEINYWKDTALHHAPDAKMILVGTKLDLEKERVVQKDEAESLAHDWGIPYFETSSKMNVMVNQVFHKLAEMMAEE